MITRWLAGWGFKVIPGVRIGAVIAIGCLLAGLAMNGPARAASPQYITNENPESGSAKDQPTPIEVGLVEENPGPSPAFPKLKEKLKNLDPFWRDTSLDLHLRTYYFNRNYEKTTSVEAWTFGGWLEYQSGWFKERLKVGGAWFTSLPIHAPDDKTGHKMLTPENDPISVVGLAYLKVRLIKGTELTLFRQTFDLPYVNRDDIRMVPNTFEAYTLSSTSLPNLKFLVSHVTKMKPINSNTFVSMSEAAGFADTDNGLTMGGLLYSFGNWATLGFIDQYAWNYMNTFYSEGTASWELTKGLELRLSAQLTDQRNVGDSLDGTFANQVFGFDAALSYEGFKLNFSITDVQGDSRIRAPFGGYPGYISRIQKDFNRAEETAVLIGATYNFTELSLPELTVNAAAVFGQTPDSGPNTSPSQDEYNLTIDYRFDSKGLLDSLWLRVRGSWVDMDEDLGGRDSFDFRVILNYDFSLL